MPRPLPPAGVLTRLRSSVRLHQLVPLSVALLLTDLVYRAAARMRRGRLDQARRTMQAVAGATLPAPEVDRLALDHVGAMARGEELWWHPRAVRRLDLVGAEHLDSAVAAGDGVVVSFVHLGAEMAWSRLHQHVPMLMPLADWAVEPPLPGFNGRQVEHRRAMLVAAGAHLVHAKGSFRAIRRTLDAGGVVLLAMDVPGPQPTRYLGTEVEMADGTARLALATGAAVVPAAVVPAGRSWRVELHPAIRPADHASAAELHQVLADLHSEIVLRTPEQLGSPLRPGFWARATPAGWFRE